MTVTVPAAGLYKKVELTIENETEEEMDVQAAYYIEPVLGSIGGTRATRWPAGSRGRS